MKVIKSKEDLHGGLFWCRTTKENYNALKKLGFKYLSKEYEEIANDKDFDDSDIFQLSNSEYISWCSYGGRVGKEVSFNLEDVLGLASLGFREPETFQVEILKVYKSDEITEYIGVVNNNIPAKWNSDGVCINPGDKYNLYREYKQRIYTKENALGFFPKQKFKISWTEKMSLGLEQGGWKLATNEEIESFKS